MLMHTLRDPRIRISKLRRVKGDQHRRMLPWGAWERRSTCGLRWGRGFGKGQEAAQCLRKFTTLYLRSWAQPCLLREGRHRSGISFNKVDQGQRLLLQFLRDWVLSRPTTGWSARRPRRVAGNIPSCVVFSRSIARREGRLRRPCRGISHLGGVQEDGDCGRARTIFDVRSRPGGEAARIQSGEFRLRFSDRRLALCRCIVSAGISV